MLKMSITEKVLWVLRVNATVMDRGASDRQFDL